MAKAHSRASIRVGRAFGIDVFFHTTFLLLLAVVALFSFYWNKDIASAVEFMALIVALFVCVLLHEFGHALTARRFGIQTREITLLPFGGIANLERLPERPRDEILVAVAGPLVNLVIALAITGGLYLHGWITGQIWYDLETNPLLLQLLWMNLTLGVFNLLPAFPMDGGRVLRAVLALRLNSLQATRYAARTGQVMAAAFAIVGAIYNPMLLIIAAFVFLAAGAELRAQEQRALLARGSVKSCMVTRFHALEASDSLSQAVVQLLSGTQQDFPVLFGGRIVGLLTRADLIKALGEQRQDVCLWMVMRRDVQPISPDAPLVDALNAMQAGGLTALPVIEGEMLVGLITLENIQEFAMIQRATREPHPTNAVPVP